MLVMELIHGVKSFTSAIDDLRRTKPYMFDKDGKLKSLFEIAMS